MSKSLEEFRETMSVALIVGGSIMIPHLRNAFDLWEQIQSRKKSGGTS